MKAKWLKVVLLAATVMLAWPLSGCAAKSEAASAAGDEPVAVTRGNISIDITAAGNLSYSQQEDLAFDIAGYVEEVSVEVGDSVKSGQVLAKLDTSDWEDSLADAEDQVTAAERSLLQSQISLKNAQVALDNAENPYTKDDIKEAKQNLALAESQLRYDMQHGSESAILQDEEKVYQLQQTYDDMVDGGDEDDIAVKQMQYDLAVGQLEDAEAAVTKAQENLADAQSESPEIIAPFDGFITAINVSGGDEVYKGTVAMQIADPTRFEASLLVSEMDIYQVKVGSEAEVTVSAVDGVSLPAQVTYISPTATVSSGVVNYDVTVEVTPLETIRQQQATDAASSTTTLLPEDFDLREGLSVVVSIVIQQANDVLLVPNRAITYQAGAAYVQVVAADGTIEDRAIQTGISDYQYTEVTDGLTDGEQVIVPQSSTTATSTTTEDQQQGGMMIPGMGGVGGGAPPSGGGGPPPG